MPASDKLAFFLGKCQLFLDGTIFEILRIEYLKLINQNKFKENGTKH